MWAAEAKAKIDIPLASEIVKKGTIVTITKGVKESFALWGHYYVWDLPADYIDITTIKIISQ